MDSPKARVLLGPAGSHADPDHHANKGAEGPAADRHEERGFFTQDVAGGTSTLIQGAPPWSSRRRSPVERMLERGDVDYSDSKTNSQYIFRSSSVERNVVVDRGCMKMNGAHEDDDAHDFPRHHTLRRIRELINEDRNYAEAFQLAIQYGDEDVLLETLRTIYYFRTSRELRSVDLGTRSRFSNALPEDHAVDAGNPLSAAPAYGRTLKHAQFSGEGLVVPRRRSPGERGAGGLAAQRTLKGAALPGVVGSIVSDGSHDRGVASRSTAGALSRRAGVGRNGRGSESVVVAHDPRDEGRPEKHGGGPEKHRRDNREGVLHFSGHEMNALGYCEDDVETDYRRTTSVGDGLHAPGNIAETALWRRGQCGSSTAGASLDAMDQAALTEEQMRLILRMLITMLTRDTPKVLQRGFEERRRPPFLRDENFSTRPRTISTTGVFLQSARSSPDLSLFPQSRGASRGFDTTAHQFCSPTARALVNASDVEQKFAELLEVCCAWLTRNAKQLRFRARAEVMDCCMRLTECRLLSREVHTMASILYDSMTACVD